MWSPRQVTHFQCRHCSQAGSFASFRIATRWKRPTAIVSPAKDTGNAGKRNCQSSEAKLPQRDSNPGPAGRQSNGVSHSATAPPLGLQHIALHYQWMRAPFGHCIHVYPPSFVQRVLHSQGTTVIRTNLRHSYEESVVSDHRKPPSWIRKPIPF